MVRIYVIPIFMVNIVKITFFYLNTCTYLIFSYELMFIFQIADNLNLIASKWTLY